MWPLLFLTPTLTSCPSPSCLVPTPALSYGAVMESRESGWRGFSPRMSRVHVSCPCPAPMCCVPALRPCPASMPVPPYEVIKSRGGEGSSLRMSRAHVVSCAHTRRPCLLSVRRGDRVRWDRSSDHGRLSGVFGSTTSSPAPCV